MWASLKGYLRSPLYRLSLVTALVAGAATYIVIGFAPTLFVDRGITLTVVGVLIGVGRLISVGGKFVRLGVRPLRRAPIGPVDHVHDRHLRRAAGRAARGWGVIAVVPFVLIVSCLFPISNALSVAGLPERSTWGIGVYRGLLVGSSALLAGIVGLLLDHLSLNAVMYGSLLLPVAGGVAAGAMIRAESSTPSVAGALTERPPVSHTVYKQPERMLMLGPQEFRSALEAARRVPLEEPPVLQDLGCR